MPLTMKRVLRLLAMAAAVAIVSLAFLPGSSGSGPYASTLDDSADVTPVMGPPPDCENKECLTACWVDGCKKNRGTKCVRTEMQPLSCPPETGGCVTQTC